MGGTETFEATLPHDFGSVGEGPVRTTSGVSTVLLVEDEPAIREALADTLCECGWEVEAATNGMEALELLQHGLRPAAILLDLMMPGMDGWDFRQRQLADPKLADIPTVVVSGAGFSAQSIRAQFGEVGFVPKPFEEEDLLAALAEARRSE